MGAGLGAAHLHPGSDPEPAERPKTDWHRSLLLVAAITLHNVLEGLAAGVAVGGAGSGLATATLGSALALPLGIGLQSFLEGVAVALPLRGEGMSRPKAWLCGQASAPVEPVALR